jgi:hypothetical protein
MVAKQGGKQGGKHRALNSSRLVENMTSQGRHTDGGPPQPSRSATAGRPVYTWRLNRELSNRAHYAAESMMRRAFVRRQPWKNGSAGRGL